MLYDDDMKLDSGGARASLVTRVVVRCVCSLAGYAVCKLIPGVRSQIMFAGSTRAALFLYDVILFTPSNSA